MLMCKRCGRENLTEDDFSADKRTPTGRRYECKECQRERGRKYSEKYYKKNSKEVLKKAKARYQKKIEGKKNFLDVNQSIG